MNLQLELFKKMLGNLSSSWTWNKQKIFSSSEKSQVVLWLFELVILTFVSVKNCNWNVGEFHPHCDWLKEFEKFYLSEPQNQGCKRPICEDSVCLTCHSTLRSLFRCHLLYLAWVSCRNLNLGVTEDARKDNRQTTKHAQSWGQVGWVLWWRHISNLHLSEFIIYCSNSWQRDIYWGRRHSIVILRNKRNLWQLPFEIKHVRKNSYIASCPLLQLRLCQFKCSIYWA
jgi:hypothetical protein